MKTHKPILFVLLFVASSVPGLTAVSHAGVKEQIQKLESKVNDIRSKVNGIKQRTDFIPNNETERRDLFNGLEPGRVREMFDLFKQGLVRPRHWI